MLAIINDETSGKAFWRYKPLGLALHTPMLALLVAGVTF